MSRTGTRENDSHETMAIKAVLAHCGSGAVSSIKSMLRAFHHRRGAVEFIACVLALRDSDPAADDQPAMPPTLPAILTMFLIAQGAHA